MQNTANWSSGTEDLFHRQKETWATVPPSIQEKIVRNVRNTIQARVYQVHGKQEERTQAYHDDWEPVGAEAHSRESNQINAETMPGRTERQVPAMESNLEQVNASQETDLTFIYSQSSIARRIGELESDMASQDSGVLGIGPIPDREMSPCLSLRLSIGLEVLEESQAPKAWLGDRQPDHNDPGPPGSNSSGT